jgi:hypothetical protein
MWISNEASGLLDLTDVCNVKKDFLAQGMVFVVFLQSRLGQRAKIEFPSKEERDSFYNAVEKMVGAKKIG